jgi:hypothetical protein
MLRKRGPGGPWVTARAHYGGSALNGWGVQVKGRRKPAWMASLLAPVSEARSQGRRNRRDGASERRFCYYQGASFGAPSPLKKGRSTKSLNSRGGARMRALGCLKFEFDDCITRVPGTMQRSSRCFAELGPYRTPPFVRPRLCEASLRKSYALHRARDTESKSPARRGWPGRGSCPQSRLRRA